MQSTRIINDIVRHRFLPRYYFITFLELSGLVMSANTRE